ncbi:MAG: phosphotransferase [Caldilineaceae bacterium]
MAYELYSSVDELLAPETLTVLTGERVNYVRCLPMEGGFSGSVLLTVEANSDKGVRRFVLKRMSPKWDWIMEATTDHHCRSVTVWQTGLLDRLQPTITHAILAGACDREGWAMLMEDMSATLMTDQPFTADQVYCLLYALATIHATFWEESKLTDPALGLSTSMDLIQIFAPATGQRFAAVPSPIPRILVEGWSALPALIAPDIVDVLNNLFMEPQPLCTALARYPATLVHGDYRRQNLGITAGHAAPQAVILDWQLAGYSAATIDLAWFLSTPSMLLSPVATDVATAYYRQQIAEQLGARFDESKWQPLLALGQLANVLRGACPKARAVVTATDETLRATHRRALEFYSVQVRAALQWL